MPQRTPVVRVGLGSWEDYELEVAEAIEAGAVDMALEAYGDAVCNAVELALHCVERYGLRVRSVEVGRRRRGGKKRIWIRILLTRAGGGPGLGDGREAEGEAKQEDGGPAPPLR